MHILQNINHPLTNTQELFVENEKNFLFHFAFTLFLDAKLSRKGRLIYHELLKEAFTTKQDRVLINYPRLAFRYKHSHEYFRSAFEELEKKGYAYRESKNKSKELYIKIILEKFFMEIEEYTLFFMGKEQSETS